jgi:hypothetical protein
MQTEASKSHATKLMNIPEVARHSNASSIRPMAKRCESLAL